MEAEVGALPCALLRGGGSRCDATERRAGTTRSANERRRPHRRRRLLSHSRRSATRRSASIIPLARASTVAIAHFRKCFAIRVECVLTRPRQRCKRPFSSRFAAGNQRVVGPGWGSVVAASRALPGCIAVRGVRRCDATGVALEGWPTTGDRGRTSSFLGVNRRSSRSPPLAVWAQFNPPLASSSAPRSVGSTRAMAEEPLPGCPPDRRRDGP